jgi:[NiFe] hydrogenase diaphorase moiety large subunit
LAGIAIAALAIGAKKAFLYLRGEYRYLEPKIAEKIKKFKSLEIELRLGAGAYVCGDETALLESLEGNRGEARNKPPFPVEKGFNQSPTVINNVETLCCVPHIILDGAATFAAIGTEKSKGPKLFSVSGDVFKPGVYECPLGISLEELLKKAGAKDVKAVICGGASGIIVGKEGLKRKLAFEDLPPSGAIIVLNHFRHILEVIENIMEFFLEESCGQCVPCREGTYRILQFVQTLKKQKKVPAAEIQKYLELAETMNIASKCGLGQSSVNIFLSALETFKNEIIRN